MGRGSRGLVAATALTVAVLGAAPGSAQALNVFGQGEPKGTAAFVDLSWVSAGERNDVTVHPHGAVRNSDYATPQVLPTSVTIQDTATPLGPVSGICTQTSPSQAVCAWPHGIDFVSAFLGSGADRFVADEGPPIGWDVSTGDGADRVILPATSYAAVSTGAGDDTIVVGTTGGGSIDCGPGIDVSVFAGVPSSTANCETTP